MNISSVVVRTKPESVEELIEQIKKVEGCDYHFHDDTGRIIVTIEAEKLSEEIAALHKLEALPNVVSAEMVYSYAEDELEAERAKIGVTSVAHEILNSDENIENLYYGGSVYNHLSGKRK